MTTDRTRHSGTSSGAGGGQLESLERRMLLSSRVIGYLPDYHYGAVINRLDWSAITHMNYFAIVANSSGGLASTTSSGYSFAQLDAAVTAAHSHGVSASIVIDPGSAFTTIDASPSITNTFITNLKAFAQAHAFEGVDLDWEPAWGTATVTQINNYGSLINAIKAQAPELILSAAVNPLQVPTDPNNITHAYVVPLSAVNNLDIINVMGYDLSLPDHANYTQTINALNNWASYAAPAGVSKSKFVLGVPFYARNSSGWGATMTYQQIVDTYLPPPSADDVSGWYYNGPTTMQNKSNYVLSNGYGGIMIWELSQDHFTGSQYDQTSLLPVIKNAMGLTAFTTLDGSGNLVATGDNSANTFSLSITSSTVTITLGQTTRTYPAAMVNTITVNGLGGDDTVNFIASASKQVTFAGGTGNDTLNVNAGTFTFSGDASAGSSNLAISVAFGANVNFNASQHLASLAISGNASLSQNGGMVLVTRNLAIASGALDLNDNDLVLDYTGATQLAAVESLIASGRNGGTWTGSGLTSTSARNSVQQNTTLGAMEASQYAGGATFDGVTLDGTMVLVKYTYYGDTDFNGKVDGADYARIDTTFNDEATLGNIGGWFNGDFDFNGKVDGADYALIDAAFNSQAAPLRPPASPKNPISLPRLR